MIAKLYKEVKITDKAVVEAVQEKDKKARVKHNSWAAILSRIWSADFNILFTVSTFYKRWLIIFFGVDLIRQGKASIQQVKF